ncbi:S1C family serine protease [Paenarthrobacter sp. JL.01a]|nr:S1C family serine protease [Paenarthrobacter sp. JL.01a]UXM93601.1 S1C family serine protease [Paenarthrobacter sp. JL.01a]
MSTSQPVAATGTASGRTWTAIFGAVLLILVIVTDAHEVEDQEKKPLKSVQIRFADGSAASATVVGVDDATDVAVVKADRGDLPSAKFPATLPQVGQLAVGPRRRFSQETSLPGSTGRTSPTRPTSLPPSARRNPASSPS